MFFTKNASGMVILIMLVLFILKSIMSLEPRMLYQQ
jgi:hypothetical protein